MIPQTDPCTVERKCSSDGMMCPRTDSACQSQATSKKLEILCTTEDDQQFLYCPMMTGHADSKAIWVLLFFAALVSVAGLLIMRRVLRSSP